jgi:tetratricopeptide (TPR) repeat protein
LKHSAAGHIAKLRMAETAQSDDLLARAREAHQRGESSSALEMLDRLIAAQPANVGALFYRAAVLQDRGRVEEAQAGYVQVIGLAPNHVPALMRLGHLARKNAGHEKSLDYFERAVAADPQHTEAHMQVAYDLRDLGRGEAAEQRLAHMLELAPRHYGALTALGYLARARGERTLSLSFFQRAAAAQPDQPQGHLQAAYDLRELGRLDDAQSAFAHVVAVAPDNVEALIALGYLARQRGDRTQSLAHFRRAAEADPGHVDAYLQMAYDLRELGQLDEAALYLEHVLALSPGHAGATQALANVARQRDLSAKQTPAASPNDSASVTPAAALSSPAVNEHMREAYRLRDLGRREDAEQAFARVLELAPNHVGALMGLGYLARAGDDRTRSLSFFDRAAAADPRNPDAAMQVAYDLRQLGRHEEAEQGFLRVLEIAPNHVPALMILGHVARAAGDRTRSLRFFERAAAHDPRHVDANLQVAYDLRELGRSAEAEAMFEQVVDLQPGNVGALIALGALARKRGDRERSFTRFQSAAAAGPDHVPAQLELATELRDRGRIEEARALIIKVASARPENAQAGMHLGRLERWAGEHAAALEAFRSVLRNDPKNVQALVESAREQLTLGHPAKSEQIIAEALAVDPTNVEALLHAAEQARLAERFADCVAICERLLAAHPKSLWGYLLAATAAAELGEREQALALLERAEQNVGPDPNITVRRFDLLAQAGDFEGARAVGRAAADQAAYNIWVWSQQVQFELNLGEFDAATQLLDKPPGGLTSHEQARVVLAKGQFAEARWQLERAVKFYRQALGLNPNDDFAHFLLSRASLLTLDVDEARTHLGQWVALNRKSRILQGQSLNLSQSHLGQLLDEFAHDRALLDELREIADALPAVRIRLLRHFIQRNGDHTASAILLLLALSEAGLLEHLATEAARSSARAIPKHIAQFWDQMEPPPDLLPLLQSWRQHHPGYEFILFNDTSARAFINEHFSSDVLQAYVQARHPAQKADLFRLAFLAARGGFYVDADDRCLASVESIVPAGADFVAYQEDFGTLGNNFLGVVPDHPVIRRALDLGALAINRGDSDTMWLSTGPGLLTRAFAQVLADSPDPETWLERNIVIERWHYHRAVAEHARAQYKRSPRHWSRDAFNKRRQPRS